MKQKLFGKSIPVSCEHCSHSALGTEGALVCTKKRVRKEDGACRRYKYDPLKRTPQNPPELPEYRPEDFAL